MSIRVPPGTSVSVASADAGMSGSVRVNASGAACCCWAGGRSTAPTATALPSAASPAARRADQHRLPPPGPPLGPDPHQQRREQGRRLRQVLRLGQHLLRGQPGQQAGQPGEGVHLRRAVGAAGQVLLEDPPVVRRERPEDVGGGVVGEAIGHAVTPFSSNVSLSARSA